MSFFSPRTPSPSRRAGVGCRHCGERITLADRIRKDGDSFVHQTCGSTPPIVAAQRSS